jgi:hypothetical protein
MNNKVMKKIIKDITILDGDSVVLENAANAKIENICRKSCVANLGGNCHRRQTCIDCRPRGD